MMDFLGSNAKGHWFYLIAIIAAFVLLFLMKGRKRAFLFPAVLMALLIANPVFRDIWEQKLGLGYYWRILWIVPVIPLCACLPSILSERIRNPNLKGIVALLLAGFFALTGTYLYDQQFCDFDIPAENNSKLPQQAVAVANQILKVDQNPRMVASRGISIYIRQFASDIDTLFGRDVDGYIYWPSISAQRVNAEMNSEEGDYSIVAQEMLDNDYNYLITKDEDEHVKQELEANQFELLSRAYEYGIYRVHGHPTVRKERNNLGQVISVTCIDKNGKAINGPGRYSKIKYTYNSDGYVIRDIRMAIGQMDDEAGYAGIINEYTETGKRIKRIFIDENENTINRKDGYSEIRWEEGEHGVKPCFFNLEGQEISSRGINLIENALSDWADWMEPQTNVENCCFSFASVGLDSNEAGDKYTCQIDIEFSGVKGIDGYPFLFYSQGAADGRWDIGNMWNGVVWLDDAPEDGVYHFTRTMTIDDAMAKANSFDLGFRCDNWAGGKFRVRHIKIEKGDTPTEWTPGI